MSLRNTGSSGDYKYRGEYQEKQPVEDFTAPQPNQGWTKVKDLWYSRQQPSANLQTQADGLEHLRKWTIRTPWTPDKLKATGRIVEGQRIFDIELVTELSGRLEIEITATLQDTE